VNPTEGRQGVAARQAIGGEFPLELRAVAPAVASLQRWLNGLGAGQVNLYNSGRVALRAWLRAQAGRGADALVLPAYVCDSVLQAAAGTGVSWRFRFLPVTDALEPDPAAVLAAARDATDRACLLAIPLFGFAYSAPLREAFDAAEALGTAVAWDLTHGLLSSWARECVGTSVASLRKWCGLPDGGATLGTALGSSGPQNDDTAFAELRRGAMSAKRSWLEGAPGGEEPFLDALQAAERRLDDERGLPGISALSRDLLGSVSVPDVVARRRANAMALIRELAGVPGVHLLREDFPSDVCPFGVPVLVDNRDRVRAGLAAQRVFCPVHWPVPAGIAGAEFPETHRLAARMLTLPCDQRYDEGDMIRLGGLLRASTAG
jgi:hypothetical protein